MRCILLALTFTLAACSSDRIKTVSMCGQQCFLGDVKQAGVGACTWGYWQCPDEGGDPVCVGAGAPSPEVCDGVDNDCDGRTDEDPNVPTARMAQGCHTSCGYGQQACSDGAWSECKARQPTPEVCNGIDDDCDGIVDNPDLLPVEFCYDGPAGTVTNGVCHPGVVRCILGQKTCSNEQTPMIEQCNGKDDNCDGQIDDGTDGGVQQVDVVFVIDNSGSMAGAINTMKAATANWTTKYGNRPEVRFAIVTAPDPDMTTYGDTPHLFQNFTDAAQFNQALAQQTGSTGSGTENTLDALHEITAPQNPFNLNFRASAAKVVVVYSDEPGQSAFGNTTSSVTNELMAAAIRTHVFSDIGQSTGWGEWSVMASMTGGTLNSLYSTEPDIEADLDAIIQNAACH